jgi:hypothetical protein
MPTTENIQSPEPSLTEPKSITLKVRGCGHIPGKKNRLYPRQDGGVMTDKKSRAKQAWIVNSLFISLCELATTGGVMLTMAQLRFLIASLPQDDDWKHIPIITITAIKVPKGEEGADVTIQRLKDS